MKLFQELYIHLFIFREKVSLVFHSNRHKNEYYGLHFEQSNNLNKRRILQGKWVLVSTAYIIFLLSDQVAMKGLRIYWYFDLLRNKIWRRLPLYLLLAFCSDNFFYRFRFVHVFKLHFNCLLKKKLFQFVKLPSCQRTLEYDSLPLQCFLGYALGCGGPHLLLEWSCGQA